MLGMIFLTGINLHGFVLFRILRPELEMLLTIIKWSRQLYRVATSSLYRFVVEYVQPFLGLGRRYALQTLLQTPTLGTSLPSDIIWAATPQGEESEAAVGISATAGGLPPHRPMIMSI